MNLNKLKLLAGDASFRKFYRSKNNSLIVYSSKSKYLNLVIYDAINRCLNINKINAPKLKKECYNKNYIEIEDLGDNSLYKILKKKKNKFKIYQNIIKTVKLIQKNKLLNESRLFLHWYLPTVLKKTKIRKAKKQIENIFYNLYKNLQLKEKVFVHRDFHVSNMMFYKKKIYLIDNQDAVYGNIAYDLASLIDDVRLKTSKELKNRIFKMFVKLNSSIDQNKLRNDFEILSVLRNLKVIGVFSRLAARDGKKEYMKMIPYAWKMIEQRMSKNFIFRDLELNLNKYFSKKVRLKKWK